VHTILAFCNRIKIVWYCAQIDNNCSVLELLEDPDDSHSDDDVEDSASVDLGPVRRLGSYLHHLGECTIDTESLLTKFVADMPYTDTDIHCIEQATVGQHCSANWHELRKQLVTASNFKRVLSRTETILANPSESCTSLLNDLVSEAKDLDHVAAIAWGRKKENTARMMYTRVERKKHIGLTVRTTGLFISGENPFLGCSPDGIVSCRCKSQHEDRLIEIKCPHSRRLSTPKEAAVHCGVVVDGDTRTLDKNHKYYAQIQGQCGIVGVNMCELIVFTTKGIDVIPVPFDSEYYAYLSRVLRFFVTQFYIPRAVADLAAITTG